VFEGKLAPADGYIAAAPAMGRGVFAARAFAAGEQVEVAPVILVEMDLSSAHLELRTRLYQWGQLCGDGDAKAIALGFGSLYNHSDAPNLRYEPDAARGLMRYYAMRDIQRDEQLTIDYDQPIPGDEAQPSWFELQGITKLAL